MLKHLFNSLLISFIVLVLAEQLRPGFVTNFINMDWLFLILIAVAFILLFSKQVINIKVEDKE